MLAAKIPYFPSLKTLYYFGAYTLRTRRSRWRTGRSATVSPDVTPVGVSCRLHLCRVLFNWPVQAPEQHIPVLRWHAAGAG
jgi:hypothetical protein